MEWRVQLDVPSSMTLRAGVVLTIPYRVGVVLHISTQLLYEHHVRSVPTCRGTP